MPLVLLLLLLLLLLPSSSKVDLKRDGIVPIRDLLGEVVAGEVVATADPPSMIYFGMKEDPQGPFLGLLFKEEDDEEVVVVA